MSAAEKLSPSVYESIRDVVYRTSGISLGPDKVSLVAARLSERLSALNLADPLAYLHRLQTDQSELSKLLDVISTNVTQFFRDPEHFDFICDWARARYEEGQREFRFWSAACSSGEEPYSLAIALLQVPQLRTCSVKILATDISTRILGQAMHGVYEARTLQPVSPQLQARYFQPQADGSFRVGDDVRRLVMFRHFNLMHLPSPVPPRIDVVLCRNVMIYFDNEVRERVVGEFYRVVKPGGHLIVARSESLLGLKQSFSPVRASIYVKSEGTERS